MRKIDENSIKSLGKKLEQLRKNQELSQDEASAKVGVSRKTLSSIENGGNFTILVLVKLLRLYGKLDDLENILSLPQGFDMDAFQTELRKSRRKRRTYNQSA